MKIGFVGAGKVGFTLGKYISEKKDCLLGYYSRSLQSAKEAAEFTQSRYFETLEEIISASDVLFLTVPDGVISELWDSIRQYSISGKCICHCSGAMSMSVFSGIDEAKAFGYSIHPLFAVSDKLHSYREISEAYFTIEGDEKYLDYWKEFFSDLGNPVNIVSGENKVLYHGAAVFASNLVIGVYEQSVNILMECGFSREDAKEAIKPLFLFNAKKIAEVGTMEALTGPVERNDLGTVDKHLNVLSGLNNEIYRDLSRVLVNIASQKHPNRSYQEMIEKLEKKED